MSLLLEVTSATIATLGLMQVILGLALGALAGSITERKGQGKWFGFTLGFFFNIVGLLLALAMVDLSTHHRKDQANTSFSKHKGLLCPNCSDFVSTKDTICPACKTTLPSNTARSSEESEALWQR